jgi:hypothetical protein
MVGVGAIRGEAHLEVVVESVAVGVGERRDRLGRARQPQGLLERVAQAVLVRVEPAGEHRHVGRVRIELQHELEPVDHAVAVDVGVARGVRALRVERVRADDELDRVGDHVRVRVARRIERPADAQAEQHELGRVADAVVGRAAVVVIVRAAVRERRVGVERIGHEVQLDEVGHTVSVRVGVGRDRGRRAARDHQGFQRVADRVARRAGGVVRVARAAREGRVGVEWIGPLDQLEEVDQRVRVEVAVPEQDRRRAVEGIGAGAELGEIGHEIAVAVGRARGRARALLQQHVLERVREPVAVRVRAAVDARIVRVEGIRAGAHLGHVPQSVAVAVVQGRGGRKRAGAHEPALQAVLDAVTVRPEQSAVVVVGSVEGREVRIEQVGGDRELEPVGHVVAVEIEGAPVGRRARAERIRAAARLEHVREAVGIAVGARRQGRRRAAAQEVGLERVRDAVERGAARVGQICGAVGERHVEVEGIQVARDLEVVGHLVAVGVARGGDGCDGATLEQVALEAVAQRVGPRARERVVVVRALDDG